jgi:outer membrane protein
VKLFKSTILAALIIAALMLLSSCVGHKPPPAIIHADNYTAETLESQQVIPPADRILGLKESIRIALTNNPTYQQKHLAIVTAWATFYTQLAGYSPTLSMNYTLQQAQGSQAAMNSPNGSTPGAAVVVPPTNVSTRPFSQVNSTYGAGLNMGWNLFNGFQTTFGALSAYKGARSAEQMDADYRRQLIYMVTTAYNAILLARAKIQIDLSDEAFQLQQLKDSQLKYNAGASSLADLLNYEIYAAQAKDAVVTDTAAYKVNRYTLAALMGLTTADLPEATQFPAIKVSQDEEYSLGVEFYLDLAIAQRPDLKAARLDLDAVRFSLYQTWGQFSPTVDMSMGYGFNRGNSGVNWGQSQGIARGQDLQYNYGFTFGWNVWEGGSRIAAVRGAQAALDSQEESLMNTWITVVKEVRSAYTNLLANETHRVITEKLMEMTQQRRDLIREEYNAGNCDITTLNEAQNLLVASELQHVTSVIDVSNSRAQLNEVTGTNVLE